MFDCVFLGARSHDVAMANCARSSTTTISVCLWRHTAKKSPEVLKIIVRLFEEECGKFEEEISGVENFTSFERDLWTVVKCMCCVCCTRPSTIYTSKIKCTLQRYKERRTVIDQLTRSKKNWFFHVLKITLNVFEKILWGSVRLLLKNYIINLRVLEASRGI